MPPELVSLAIAAVSSANKAGRFEKNKVLLFLQRENRSDQTHI